jgi:hypothetical protein
MRAFYFSQLPFDHCGSFPSFLGVLVRKIRCFLLNPGTSRSGAMCLEEMKYRAMGHTPEVETTGRQSSRLRQLPAA